MWLDELAAAQYKVLRASVDNRFMGLLPTQYQDRTKSVQQTGFVLTEFVGGGIDTYATMTALTHFGMYASAPPRS